MKQDVHVGYVFLFEDGSYQGYFLDPVDDIRDAALHDSLRGIDEDHVKYKKIKYKWIQGRRVIV